MTGGNERGAIKVIYNSMFPDPVALQMIFMLRRTRRRLMMLLLLMMVHCNLLFLGALLLYLVQNKGYSSPGELTHWTISSR